MTIKEGDKWKTVFHTKYCHFKYQIIPFHLSNALLSFQEYINKTFADKFNIFVIIYVDDILIYRKKTDQLYVHAIRWILKQLQKHGFYTNLKKYHFHQDEVQFLGCIVMAKGIQIKEKQVKSQVDPLQCSEQLIPKQLSSLRTEEKLVVMKITIKLVVMIIEVYMGQLRLRKTPSPKGNFSLLKLG